MRAGAAEFEAGLHKIFVALIAGPRHDLLGDHRGQSGLRADPANIAVKRDGMAAIRRIRQIIGIDVRRLARIDGADAQLAAALRPGEVAEDRHARLWAHDIGARLPEEADAELAVRPVEVGQSLDETTEIEG